MKILYTETIIRLCDNYYPVKQKLLIFIISNHHVQYFTGTTSHRVYWNQILEISMWVTHAKFIFEVYKNKNSRQLPLYPADVYTHVIKICHKNIREDLLISFF